MCGLKPPLAPGPRRNQSRRSPPIGETESSKGIQGDISSWSQTEGREGEAASLRALEGDSESPPRQWGLSPLRGLQGGIHPAQYGISHELLPSPPNVLLLTLFPVEANVKLGLL